MAKAKVRGEYSKTAQTKERVFQAALKSLGAKGVEHTTFEEIAKRAKCSVGLVTLYLGKRKDLFVNVINQIAENSYPLLESTAGLQGRQRLEKYIEVNFELFAHRPDYLPCFLILWQKSAHDSRLRALNTELYQRAIDRFAAAVREWAADSKHKVHYSNLAVRIYLIMTGLIERYFTVNHGTSNYANYRKYCMEVIHAELDQIEESFND